MEGQGGFRKAQNTTERCPNGDMDDNLGVRQYLIRLRPELAPYGAAVVPSLTAASALACLMLRKAIEEVWECVISVVVSMRARCFDMPAWHQNADAMHLALTEASSAACARLQVW